MPDDPAPSAIPIAERREVTAAKSSPALPRTASPDERAARHAKTVEKDARGELLDLDDFFAAST